MKMLNINMFSWSCSAALLFSALLLDLGCFSRAFEPFEMSEDDGCFPTDGINGTLPEDSSVCGWVSDCDIAGCNNTCAPSWKPRNSLTKLHILNTIQGFRCTVMASFVHGMVSSMMESGMDGMRKLLENRDALSASKDLSKAISAKVLRTAHKFSRVKGGTHLDDSVLSLTTRRLREADDMDMSCPSEDEIDEIAPMLLIASAMYSAFPDEDMSIEEKAIMEMINPTKLKDLFKNKCVTAPVSSEIMVSFIGSLATMEDDYGDIDFSSIMAAENASLSANLTSYDIDSGPKDTHPLGCLDREGKDEQALSSMMTAAMKCPHPKGAQACAGSEISMSMNEECFAELNPFATVSDVMTIKMKYQAIFDMCTSMTSEMDCARVDMKSEKESILNVMDDLAEAAMKQMQSSPMPVADKGMLINCACRRLV